MNDKLPIEVKKNNIFTIFFRKLKNIFKKKVGTDIIQDDKELNSNITFQKDNFEKIKTEPVTKRRPQKVVEEIIQIIEKNPYALEKLDIEKLEIIDAYYKHKIAECKRKLKRA